MVKTIIEILKTDTEFYIITWWKIDTINKNVVNVLIKNWVTEEQLKNLKLMPVFWSELYKYSTKEKEYILTEEKTEFNVSKEDHKKIVENFNKVFKEITKKSEEKWTNTWVSEINQIIEKETIWEQIENRGKTVALSIFWQDASSDTKDKLKQIEKSNGNIDIRQILIDKYKELFPDTTLTMVKWGSTTIDITKWKLDKSVWYNMVRWNIDSSKTLFLWDLWYPGWNDYEWFKANNRAWWINHLVNNHYETKFFLRAILNRKKSK